MAEQSTKRQTTQWLNKVQKRQTTQWLNKSQKDRKHNG
jgi:hypothetical protein